MTFDFPDGSRTVVNSFPSPEKFPFCTDKIETIEYQVLVSRHSKWNCVGANRPQHRHMYSLIA